jgi:ribosomal protein S18 acetylase RimI-like enzyme
MSISIHDLEFKVLDASHLRQLTSFRCKNAELKDFLTQDALKNQLDRISVTRLVFYHGRLVGYFTLVTDVIKRGEIADSDGAEDFRYATYSALKIARFATDIEFERQGIGRNMLLKIFAIWIRLSKYIGCRIITVDSKPEAVGFYKKFDFHEAIIDKRKIKDNGTIPLYIDIHKELERTERNTPLTKG